MAGAAPLLARRRSDRDAKVRDDRRSAPGASRARRSHRRALAVRVRGRPRPGRRSTARCSDERTREVGTLYAQASAFDAKKLGAAIVSRNIARHRRDASRQAARVGAARLLLARRPAQPRARARAERDRLARRAARRRLSRLPAARRRRARQAARRVSHIASICGLTGSGKSRLLAALAHGGRAGARPRGARAAPRLAARRPARRPAAVAEDVREPAARRCDASIPLRPVFVESESQQDRPAAGARGVARAMRGAPCVRVDTPRALRVALLKDEYAHFLADPDALARAARAARPAARQGDDRALGRTGARRGDFDALVARPARRRTTTRCTRARSSAISRASRDALVVAPRRRVDAAFAALAGECARRRLAPRARSARR